MADIGLIQGDTPSEVQATIDKQNQFESSQNEQPFKKQSEQASKNNSERSPLKEIANENIETLLIEQEPSQPKTVVEKVAEKADQNQDEKVCLVHNKLRDIVCTVDMEIVCSNCAIFCHKGHDFKSLNDFEMDKLRHCQALVEITELKKKMQQSISGKNAIHQTRERFEAIRTQLTQQLKAKFKCLYQQLQLSEERCIEKINKGISQQEDRIKFMMSIPSRIEENYKRWQGGLYSQMRVFELQDTKAQMALLNYDKKQEDNFIGRGNEIVQEIRNYMNKVNLKAEESYGCFTLEFDSEIQRKISGIHQTVLKKFRKAAMQDPDMSYTRINTESKLQITIPEEQLLDQKVPYKSPFYKESNNIGYHYQSEQTESRIFIPHSVRMARQPSIYQSSIKDSISTLAFNQNIMISTIKTQNSPSKEFVLPSPRNFLSPTKHRQITVDAKLKKILTKLKLPEKYYRMVVSIIYEGAETFDLTNCGLDESAISTLLEILKSNKNIRVLKLIRNRLTDEMIEKLVGCFPKIMVLNLSQNNLTQRIFDIMLSEIQSLTNLRTIVLTQNKIKEKGAKGKLEELKKHNISVIM